MPRSTPASRITYSHGHAGHENYGYWSFEVKEDFSSYQSASVAGWMVFSIALTVWYQQTAIHVSYHHNTMERSILWE
ncbi:MAG: hypothetical protein EOM12_12825 [Verrucomicrobiae bacterium]|nr:hypothetical protein [Verrucomicrobiae bacterium]